MQDGPPRESRRRSPRGAIMSEAMLAKNTSRRVTRPPVANRSCHDSKLDVAEFENNTCDRCSATVDWSVHLHGLGRRTTNDRVFQSTGSIRSHGNNPNEVARPSTTTRTCLARSRAFASLRRVVLPEHGASGMLVFRHNEDARIADESVLSRPIGIGRSRDRAAGEPFAGSPRARLSVRRLPLFGRSHSAAGGAAGRSASEALWLLRYFYDPSSHGLLTLSA